MARSTARVAVIESLEARLVMSVSPTTTALAVSASRLEYGQSATLTANVSSPDGTVNDGTITFRDGNTVLGSAAVMSGSASMSSGLLGVGNHTLTASFSGGTGFADSSSGIDGTSLIQTVAGNHTTGFSGDGGSATAAQFNYPSNLAVDAAGNIYIVDNGNNRIRKVTPGGTVTTVAGNGTGGFSGDNGPATSAQLSNPYSVAVDPSGVLYIGDDGNNRIRKVDLNGTITTVAGTGTSGFSGDGGPATAANIRVASMAFWNGNIYFTDQGNGYVRKIDSSGIITTLAGTGTTGYSGDGGLATAAQIRSPYGIGVDPAGNVYFAEISNHVIRKIDTSGIISTYAGTGTAGSTGDGGPATSARLSTPGGMAVDAQGNVYFNQFGTNQIRKVSADGIIQTIAGTGTAGYTGDGGPSNLAQLNDTEGLGIDAAGNLYLADSSNNVVRRVSGAASLVVDAARTVTTLLPSANSIIQGQSLSLTANVITVGSPTGINEGTISFYDGTTLLGTAPVVNGTAMLSTSTLPIGLHDLSVAYSGTASFLNSSTAAIAPTSMLSRIAGDGTQGFNGDGGQASSALLTGPRNVAIDAQGNLYIADEVNFRVRKITPDGIITTIAGNGTNANTGDNGPAISASIGSVEGIAVDSSGNIYLAEFANNVIRKIDINGIITTFAGTGTAANSGDGGQATAAGLNNPLGMVFDAQGNLYVGVFGAVRKISTNGIITTVVGTGTAGNSGDGGLATAAQVSYPYNLALDAAGNLYIADYNSSVIRKVDATSGLISTVAGTGTLDTSGTNGNNGPAIQANLGNPSGVVVDVLGNIYFHDGVSLRVVTPDGILHRLDGQGTGSLASGGPVSGATVNGDLVGLTTDHAGNLYLAVYNSSAIYRVASPLVTVNVTAAPVKFLVTAGGPATAGVAETYTITAVDTQGNTIAGYNGTLTVSSSDPLATLPQTINVVNGVTTFSATLFTAGNASITVTDAQNASLFGSTVDLSVTPATAATFGFAVTTQDQPVGSRLVTVTAYDAYGNVATGYTGTANVTSSDPSYAVPATINFVAGVATFTGATGIASIPAITVSDSINPSITGTLQGDTTPTVATGFKVEVVTAGGTAGAATTIRVTAIDAEGNLVTNFNGPITLASSDSQAVLPGNVTLVNGIATFDVNLRTAGSQSINVSADDEGTTLSGSVSGLAVTPAAASRLAVTTNASTVAGQPTSVTVTAYDAFGNVATGLGGLLTLSSSDAKAMLPIGTILVNGTATFQANLLTAGAQTLTIGADGGSLTGTANIAVTPAAASRLVVTLSPGLSGGSATLTVTAYDAYGNVATGYTGPVQITSSDATAVVPATGVLVNGTASFAVTLGSNPSQTVTVTDAVNAILTATSTPTQVTGLARGVVFLDINANGVQDAGETGLSGRTVYLDLNGNGRLDSNEPTAVTNASGRFSFPGVAQGTAPIREASDRDSTLRIVVDQTSTLTDGSTTIGVTPYSPIAPVPVVPDPFSGSASPSDAAAYVRSLYRAVLGREGSDAEVNTWLSGMNLGMSRDKVAAAFINSDEHRLDQVSEYYQTFFHRALDPYAYGWVDLLRGGASEQSVVSAILNSPEYQQLHGDSNSFVTNLYRDALGRDVDPGTLASTTAALASGTTRAAVVANVVNSQEATDQVIDGFYSSYFRRAADPFSAYWEGITRDQGASATAIGILTSPEFYAKARATGSTTQSS